MISLRTHLRAYRCLYPSFICLVNLPNLALHKLLLSLLVFLLLMFFQPFQYLSYKWRRPWRKEDLSFGQLLEIFVTIQPAGPP